MNPATHTPGPWQWTYHPVNNERIALVSADGKTDVLLCTGDDSHAWGAVSSEANARLIASAPDLLQALKAAAAAFDYTVAALAKGQTVSTSSLQNCAANARTAISKAEGRT